MSFSKEKLKFLSNIFEQNITNDNFDEILDNMMSWLNRRPEWAKEVKFDIKRRE